MQASDDIVEGVISVLDIYARCLFDYGLTHSFVALHFALNLGVAPTFLDFGLAVTTPVSVSLDTDVVCKNCIVKVESMLLPAD